ncbi:MAG: hypothetical protein ACJ74H_05415 [Thermoanaerobaculia bacterium]
MRKKAQLAIILLLAGGCVTGSQPIPPEWMSVPAARRIGSLTLAEDGTVTASPERMPPKLSDGPIRVIGSALMNGDKVLIDDLTLIESLDLSESRGEVAFSAKHEGGFDIALISTDGGAVHWVPHDPADEVSVQWAPRGNKISYVIRATGGDVVRTLHIPTAFQYAVPFPGATIHALAWDPRAERYAVAYSTLETSDRVEVLKYSGEERHTAIEPERMLDVDLTPFVPGAVLMRPRDVRYDEKLPLVVWITDDFAWSDARAALLTKARVAVVVTTKPPGDDLWRAAAGTAWMDASRVFVVGAETNRPGATAIAGDSSLSGRYQRRGHLVAVPPAVVQSFAAGYIAAQLERDRPTNGSSR